MINQIKRLLTQYYQDAGLLVLRLGFGGMYVILHGTQKILGGPALWVKVGSAMSHVGINFGYTFWGFMAASSEFFGGICLMLGLLFRPAAAAILFTMFIASTMHITTGQGVAVASHAMENGAVLISLLIIGPGKYSLDKLIFGKSE